MSKREEGISTGRNGTNKGQKARRMRPLHYVKMSHSKPRVALPSERSQGLKYALLVVNTQHHAIEPRHHAFGKQMRPLRRGPHFVANVRQHSASGRDTLDSV